PRTVLHPVEHLVARSRAAAAARVIAADTVADEREDRAGDAGIEHTPLAEHERARRLERVRPVAAVLRVVGAVAAEIGAVPALEIDDPEHLAPGDDAGPGLAGRHMVVANDLSRNDIAVGHVRPPPKRG